MKRLCDAQLQQQIDNVKYDIIYLNIHIYIYVYVDATYIYAYLAIINNMYHFLLYYIIFNTYLKKLLNYNNYYENTYIYIML